MLSQARIEGELLIYEAFPYCVSPTDNRLKLRFKKLEHGLILRERLSAKTKKKADSEETEKAGRSNWLRPFNDICGYSGVSMVSITRCLQIVYRPPLTYCACLFLQIVNTCPTLWHNCIPLLSLTRHNALCHYACFCSEKCLIVLELDSSILVLLQRKFLTCALFSVFVKSVCWNSSLDGSVLCSQSQKLSYIHESAVWWNYYQILHRFWLSILHTGVHMWSVPTLALHDYPGYTAYPPHGDRRGHHMYDALPQCQLP